VTSRDNLQECYVYIALSGGTEFVTAALYQRRIDRHGVAKGRFVYAKSYLSRDNAVPIDPIQLKLSTNTYETTLLRGIFGALRDASPDYWGAAFLLNITSDHPLLMKSTICFFHLTTARGLSALALVHNPPAPKRDFNRTIDLARLQEFADAIINDEALSDNPDARQAQEMMLEGEVV